MAGTPKSKTAPAADSTFFSPLVRRLAPKNRVDTSEHQIQFAPSQLADTFSQLTPVDGNNQGDIRDRFPGKACRSRGQKHITGRLPISNSS